MRETMHLKHKAFLDHKSLTVNGVEVFKNEDQLSFTEWLTHLYRSLKMEYPKFFKMDKMCRGSLILMEVFLEKTSAIEPGVNEDLAFYFSNTSSSLETDLQFFNTIKNPAQFFPSPSVFVYTLPNIMIGELCLKHGWMGEGYFSIEPEFNPEKLEKEAAFIIETGKAERVLAGWAEINRDEDKSEKNMFYISYFEKKER